MKKQISPRLISIIFSILVICFALGFYIFAWTEPSEDPPLTNVDVPLNVSNLDQTKLGALSFSEFRDVNDDTYYVNPSGAVSAVFSGNVGIGTTSPSSKLDVIGDAVVSSSLMIGTPESFQHTNNSLEFTADIAYIELYAAGTPKLYIQNNRAGNVTNVLIDGSLGIGTTSPNAKLQVAGGDVYASTAGNGLILKSPDGLTCKRVSIDNAGNLITTAVACP